MSKEKNLPGPTKQELHRLFSVGPLREPDDAAGFAIWKLSLAYQRRAEASLRNLGLTHTQFVILVLSAWLAHVQGEVNHGDIAKISGVQVAQVSLMIKALRIKKLVVQHMSTEDTRVRVVTVTTAGLKLLAKAIPMMGQLQAELWPSDSEVVDLVRNVRTTLARWEGSNE
jgi:DNA-binding MarR family transcriptional regulator